MTPGESDGPAAGQAAAPRHGARRLHDPVSLIPRYGITESRVAIAGHPIHAMLVAFPVALAFSTLGTDLLYLWTGDGFWPRVAIWAAGFAFLVGVAAGIAGTVELLLVPGIRMRSASWTHFVFAMSLLSILGLNWGYRLHLGAEAAVLPFGLLISALAGAMTAITGWHGGKLVFEYQLGSSNQSERP
jgi:uncharacterized membrane protein